MVYYRYSKSYCAISVKVQVIFALYHKMLNNANQLT